MATVFRYRSTDSSGYSAVSCEPSEACSRSPRSRNGCQATTLWSTVRYL